MVTEWVGQTPRADALDASPRPSGDAMSDGDWNDTITLVLIAALLGAVIWGLTGGMN